MPLTWPLPDADAPQHIQTPFSKHTFTRRAHQPCAPSMLTSAPGHLAEDDPSKPGVRTAVVRKVRGLDGHVTMQVRTTIVAALRSLFLCCHFPF